MSVLSWLCQAPLRVLSSLLYVVAWLVWATVFWRKRQATEAAVGPEMADALGPVLLVARVKMFFTG